MYNWGSVYNWVMYNKNQVEMARKAAQQEREAREKAQQETAMARSEKVSILLLNPLHYF